MLGSHIRVERDTLSGMQHNVPRTRVFSEAAAIQLSVATSFTTTLPVMDGWIAQ
jgi:hypothetical protein